MFNWLPFTMRCRFGYNHLVSNKWSNCLFQPICTQNIIQKLTIMSDSRCHFHDNFISWYQVLFLWKHKKCFLQEIKKKNVSGYCDQLVTSKNKNLMLRAGEKFFPFVRNEHGWSLPEPDYSIQFILLVTCIQIYPFIFLLVKLQAT